MKTLVSNKKKKRKVPSVSNLQFIAKRGSDGKGDVYNVLITRAIVYNKDGTKEVKTGQIAGGYNNYKLPSKEQVAKSLNLRMEHKILFKIPVMTKSELKKQLLIDKIKKNNRILERQNKRLIEWTRSKNINNLKINIITRRMKERMNLKSIIFKSSVYGTRQFKKLYTLDQLRNMVKKQNRYVNFIKETRKRNIPQSIENYINKDARFELVIYEESWNKIIARNLKVVEIYEKDGTISVRYANSGMVHISSNSLTALNDIVNGMSMEREL